MDFPRLVYTSPGPADCQGGTYGYEKVEDEKEFKAAIAAGFFETVPEALAAKKEDEPKRSPGRPKNEANAKK